MDILSEIHQIIKKDYPEIKEKITPKTKFKDVKIDSLKLVMIVIKIEEKHNVKINDNKLLDLQTKTVQDLINEVERLVAIENKKSNIIFYQEISMNKNFENIIQKLKDKDYRLTDVRKAVIKVLTLKQHVSINDIINFLTKEGNDNINIMSIYNTIDLLMTEHIIHANVFEGKQIIYELSENTVHIICNFCNKIIHASFEDKQQISPLQEEKLEKLATKNNFYFSHYKLEIHGICDKCELKIKKIKF